MKKTLYVFDLGNVLIDLNIPRGLGAMKAILGENFAKLGMDEHAEGDRIMGLYEKGLIGEDDFLTRVQELCPQPTTKEAIRNAWTSLHETIPPHRLEFLAKLRAEGHTLHLLSNTNTIHWKHADSNFDLTKRFDGVTISCEEHCTKPDREIYEIVMKKTGFAPQDIVFTEDRPENRAAAEALGWTTFESVEALMGGITVVGVTPEFRELDRTNEIYEEAFPPEERMFTLEQMLASPVKIDVNAYYCEGKIIGMSVLKNLGAFVYLLFFAVAKDVRSGGFGGRIFDRIIGDCGEKTLIFSIEDPSEECDNKEQRAKREAFYLKHNCVFTGRKFIFPNPGPTFCLMSSLKMDSYPSVMEAVCAANPFFAKFLEKCQVL